MPGTKEYTNTLQIKIGETTLSDDLMAALVSASVDESVGMAAMFVLSFSDPDRSVLSRARAKVGERVSLAVLTPDDATPQPLVTGEVTALEAEFGHHGSVTIIRGFDLVHRLHRARSSTVYSNVTYAEVATKVAGQAGLASGTIDATPSVHSHVGRNHCTDWQFLAGLAAEVGYEVAVHDGKLDFRKPTPATTGPAPGTLESRDDLALLPDVDLIRFRATLTSAEQVSRVEVRGWDPKTKKVVIGSAPAATTSASTGVAPAELARKFGNHVHVTGDTPFGTQAEANVAAQSIADEIAASATELEGVAVGNPKLRAGRPVSLGLTQAPFDGRYTLTSVRHRFDPEEGYTTAFTASGRRTRSLVGLTGHDAARRASGLRIPGVVIGLVSNTRDPDKMGRVKVKLPCLADDYETDWLRVAHIGAGSHRGLIFIPEVNDEVLVAFEQGDPRRPYVLGGLYNGVDKPLPAASVVNAGGGQIDSRGIVSRLGHRIVFNDDKNKVDGIQVITGGEKLQILMDEPKQTIKITSTGDVVIETQGNVSIKAQKNFEVDAQQISLKARQGVTVDGGAGDVDVKGVNVNAEAKAGAKVKGLRVDIAADTEATVKGSAVLILEGGLVKIN